MSDIHTGARQQARRLIRSIPSVSPDSPLSSSMFMGNNVAAAKQKNVEP
jgi:hypothetical protein